MHRCVLLRAFLGALLVLSPLVMPLTAGTVKIYWDANNVPYIQCPDDPGLLYGQGWALARCQYSSLKLHHAKSMGYSAKYLATTFDESDFFVQNDMIAKHLGLPVIAAQVYAQMTPPVKALIDAFTKGINDYYLVNRVMLNAKYPNWVPLLSRPATAEDTIAAGLSLYVKSYYIHSLAMVNGEPDTEAVFPTTHSNEWVIGASKSASGKPMLQVDPHIALSGDESLMTFLCGLFSSNLQAVGFNQLGAPMIGAGAKLARPGVTGDQSIAWTITAGPLDQADVYELTKTASGQSYVFDSGTLPFTIQTVRVELPDGSFLMHDFKSSVHGPVIAESTDKAYALRFVTMLSADINSQFHAMLTAKNMTEFLSALDKKAWPGGNMVIATSATAPAEQIRYILDGPCPVRDPAIDWTAPVNGSTSATLWTALHPIAELPQVSGSAQDHFINNNCGINHTWAGFASQTFPAYMIVDQTITTFRQQRAQALLDSGTIDLNAMLAAVTDKSDGPARAAQPLLVNAYRDFGSEVADPSAVLDDLIEVIRNWDTQMTVTSQVAPWFAYWAAAFMTQHPMIIDAPPLVPPVPPLDHDTAIDALELLLDSFHLVEGLGLPTWGDVHRIKRVTAGGVIATFEVGGSRDSLRSAYGHTINPDLTFDVTNGQTCPIVVVLGTDAASTEIRYTKAMDNCIDPKLVPFAITDTALWASESYHTLFTTPAQFRANPVLVETLAYP